MPECFVDKQKKAKLLYLHESFTTNIINVKLLKSQIISSVSVNVERKDSLS